MPIGKTDCRTRSSSEARKGSARLPWPGGLLAFLSPTRCPRRRRCRRVDLSVAEGSRAAGQVASLAHPDIGLLRREVNEKTKRFFTEIRTDDVRRAIGLFQRAAGAGGYRICHRRQRRGPEPLQRQRAPEAHRGAAATLALPLGRASSRPGPADDPLALAADAMGACSRTRSPEWSARWAPPWSELPAGQVAAAAARAQAAPSTVRCAGSAAAATMSRPA